MSTPYISRRLKIDASRVFACIPREGTLASPIVNGVHFPWTFDRKHASLGVPWQMRVKTFELDFNFSGNYDLLGVSTPYSYTLTGVAMERGGVVYNDLRDRQLPSETPFEHFDTTGPDTSNIAMNLFFENAPLTATAASPAFAYQADANGDIAPAFFFESQTSLAGIAGFNIYSHSVGGASNVGSGTLDGQAFDLYSDAIDGIVVLSLSASATITTLTEYVF